MLEDGPACNCYRNWTHLHLSSSSRHRPHSRLDPSAFAMSGKGRPRFRPCALGSDGDDWRLGKKPATPKSRGTTMTLRKSHTANLERSPTVFPTAKMSTFADAPSAEKRKILDEGDRRWVLSCAP